MRPGGGRSLALGTRLAPSPFPSLLSRPRALALLALSSAQIQDAFPPRSSLSARKLVKQRSDAVSQHRSCETTKLSRDEHPACSDVDTSLMCVRRLPGGVGLVPKSNIVQDLINKITCDESSNIQQDEMKFALSPLPCSSPSAASRACYTFIKYNGQK